MAVIKRSKAARKAAKKVRDDAAKLCEVYLKKVTRDEIAEEFQLAQAMKKWR